MRLLFAGLVAASLCSCGTVPDRGGGPQRTLAEADELWVRGEREGAVRRYCSLLSGNQRCPEHPQNRHETYLRVVGHLVKTKDLATARKYARMALDDGFTLVPKDAATSVLVEQVRVEFDRELAMDREAKKVREGRERYERQLEEERREKEDAAKRERERNEQRFGDLVVQRNTLSGTSRSSGIGHVEGVVENRGRSLRYAQVTVNLYDDNDNLLDSAIANVNNLETGGRWKFRAVTLVRFSKYRVSQVSGF